MSTLQIGLAIAGGLLLAGVVAHSAWSTRKNKPRQAQPLPPSKPTSSGAAALGERHFQEPSFDDTLPHDMSDEGQDDTHHLMPDEGPNESADERPLPPVRSSGQAQPSRAGVAPTDKAWADEDATHTEPGPLKSPRSAPTMGSAATDLPPREKRPAIDALIDVIATLEIELPISGDAALAAMPNTRRVGSKTFSLEGLNADTGLWETPSQGQRYSAFQTAVQLASRTGALNDIEFSDFVTKTQAFADAINATPEFPDMLEELARARELDSFANTHDAQLSFTLKSTKTAWSPGYVQQCAARLGFIAGVMPGRMVVPAGTAGLPPVLGLTFDSKAAMSDNPTQSAIYEVALSLDVPQVDRQAEPYARMIQTAYELARVMDGVISDDNNQPLSEAAIGGIARDLLALYDTLDARDLSAGSPQARRLFS